MSNTKEELRQGITLTNDMFVVCPYCGHTNNNTVPYFDLIEWTTETDETEAYFDEPDEKKFATCEDCRKHFALPPLVNFVNGIITPIMEDAVARHCQES